MTKNLKIAMEAARLLRGARDFITDRSRWVKGSLVERGVQNLDWDGHIYNAPRVCSLGAIRRVAAAQHQMTDDTKVESLPGIIEADSVLSTIMGNDIIHFNDSDDTTHEDVLAAFDLAVEESCRIVQREAAKSVEKDAS